MSDQDKTLTSKLIPAKNKPSLIAYYLGIFSFIPLIGWIVAPAAVALGVIGLRNNLKDANIRGRTHAIVGIVVGSIFSILHYGCLIWFIVGIAKEL